MMSIERRPLVHYVLAVVVLAVSAVGMQVGKRGGMFQIIKKPLPIRKALDDMDRTRLLPFEVISSRRLPPEVVSELGTEEYLDWVLEVPEGRAGPPRMMLSVTYYTGVQDQVPHVPEECMHQAAYTKRDSNTRELKSSELVRLRQAVEVRDQELERLGKESERSDSPIRVRELSFNPPRGTGNIQFIFYTICVNGEYYPDRERARLRLSDPREGHLYYSKVEVSFRLRKEKILPEVSKQAYELLDMALAELVRSHYPLTIHPDEPPIPGGAGVPEDGSG